MPLVIFLAKYILHIYRGSESALYLTVFVLLFVDSVVRGVGVATRCAISAAVTS